MTQKCNKCNEIKPVESFPLEKDPQGRAYRRKACKMCRTISANKRRHETGFYKKQYRSMSDDERSAYIKKKSQQNQHRFKTKPEALAKKKEYDRSDRGIFMRYKGDCKRRGRLTRGIEMRLSLEQFSEIINKPCYYCGIENCRGVDRVDSEDHYSLENSRPCCRVCNGMKSNRTETQFFEHIKQIIRNKGL